LPRKQSRSMTIGTALHCAFLEPERFASEYRRLSIARRGQAWKDLQMSYPAISWLSPSEHDCTLEMHKSLMAHETIRAIASNAEGVELSARFTHQEFDCQMRIDMLGLDECYDVKITNYFDGFQSDAEKYGYPLAAGFYAAGLHALGHPCNRFGFLVVENCEPYRSKIVWMDKNSLDNEVLHVDNLLKALRQCQTTGEWPDKEKADGNQIS